MIPATWKCPLAKPTPLRIDQSKIFREHAVIFYRTSVVECLFGAECVMTTTTAIPQDRPLTVVEVALVRWLLQHGIPQASGYLLQLNPARVASSCYCGCASIDFAIDGVVPPPANGISILADYEWRAAGGELFGVFVFERCGLLAGLEVWSQDGLGQATLLPDIEQLRPVGTCEIVEPSVASDCGGIT